MLPHLRPSDIRASHHAFNHRHVRHLPHAKIQMPSGAQKTQGRLAASATLPGEGPAGDPGRECRYGVRFEVWVQ